MVLAPTRTADKLRVEIQALFFIAFGFVVPLLLFYSVDLGRVEPTQFALRSSIVLYAGWVLARLLGRGRPDWFATMFWAFCYVWIGVAGLAQAFAGRDPFRQAVRSDEDVWVALVTLLGMIAWHVVYRTLSSRGHQPSKSPRFVNPRRVVAMFWTSVVLGPVLLVYLGDFLFFWHSRIETASGLAAADDSLAVRAIIVAAIQVPPAAALFGLTLMLQQYRELRFRPAWWAMVIVTLAMNVLVNSPVGTSRFWFGTVAIGWLLCWRIFRTRTGYRVAVVALIGVLTVVFPYADYFRTPDATVQARAPYEFLVEKLDYDAPAQIRNARTAFEANGPEFGRQLAGAVGFALPRSIWEDKPDPTGILLARAINFHFENLSAPLWAEGWVDWGPMGAILYPAGFAVLGGLGDRAFQRASRGGPRLSLIAVPALAVYSLILIRGSLLGTIAQGVVLTIALLLLGSRSQEPVRRSITPSHERPDISGSVR